MFLFVFDYLSVFERKNPLAAVAAFTRLPPRARGRSLVIKTINGDLRRTDRNGCGPPAARAATST